MHGCVRNMPGKQECYTTRLLMQPTRMKNKVTFVFMGVFSKLNLFCSRSTVVSESGTEEEKQQRQDDGGFRAPSPLVHGRISSDESEAEGPEDPVEFPSSAAHPKPLAVNRFYSLQKFLNFFF